MNMDIAKGKWAELKGSIQAKWGELTDDELAQVEGRREEFVGLIQQKYGKSKEEAEKAFDKIRESTH